MKYDEFFTDALARLRSERRYRVFAELEAASPAASRMRCGIRRRVPAMS